MRPAWSEAALTAVVLAAVTTCCARASAENNRSTAVTTSPQQNATVLPATGRLTPGARVESAGTAKPSGPIKRTINVPQLFFEGLYVRNKTINVSQLMFEGLYVRNKTISVSPLVFEGLYVSRNEPSSTSKPVAPAVKIKRAH